MIFLMFKKNYQLVFILLLAFFLRINGLGFGLPYVFHPDEHQYVQAGLAFLQDWPAVLAEQQKLNNPPLFKSTLGLLYLIAAHSLIPDPAALETELWQTFFHYLGRFASAAAGLLTVALLYALGRRLYSRRAGLVSALLLAVSFLPVRESHFAVNDVPLTLLAVAGLYGAAGILRRGRWFDYLLTGLLIGLAIATKYTAVYLSPALLLAHWFHQRQTNWRGIGLFLSPRFLLGGVMVPVGFAIGAPVVLISWPELRENIGMLAEYGQSGYKDLLLHPQGGWVFYLETLTWGLGWLITVALGLALIAAIRRRSAAELLLIIFPTLLYITMGAQRMFFARFILPALPPLLLLAVLWLERLSQVTWRFGPGINNKTLPVAAVMLLAIQPLLMSSWLGILLNRPDTRELAAAWLQKNVPAGSALYAERYALPGEMVTGPAVLPYVQAPEFTFDNLDPIGEYRAQGVQVLVTSDYHHQIPRIDPATEQGRQQWLVTLSQLQLLQEFQPYWWPGDWFSYEQHYGPAQEVLMRRLPGPILRIYALDPGPDWHGLDPFVEANQVPGKASLFGYEAALDQPVLPGTRLELAMYWLTTDWRDTDQLFVALVDRAGFEIARAITKPVAEFEGELDAAGSLIKSEAHLFLPPGTPPGAYQLHWGVYDQAKFEQLGLRPIEQAYVRVAEARPEFEIINDGAPSPAKKLAPGISLVTYELAGSDKAMASTLLPGQDNWLVLTWRAEQEITLDYQVQLTLLDAQAQVIASWQGHPVHGDLVTSEWGQGQLIRDPWNLRLPETVTLDQPYQLGVALIDRAGNTVGTKALGSIWVSQRERSAAIPAMQHVTEATWDNLFKLLGYDVRVIPNTETSGRLELELYWQSLAPTPIDYAIGVRLIDAQERIILIQEKQPLDGNAPTSTWQPGEVVSDHYVLAYQDLAGPAPYRLELVLTNLQTGELLPVEKDDQLMPALELISWP